MPRDIVEHCILTAGTAPSGAHMQPWHFVAVADPARKQQIRKAAEIEEAEFYRERAPQEWLDALAPLGTDEHKPFLERHFVAQGGVPARVYDLGMMQYRLVGRRAHSHRGQPGTLAVASEPSSYRETRSYVRRVEHEIGLEVHRSSQPRASSVDFARGLLRALDPRP